MPGTNNHPNERRFPRADLHGRAVLFFGKDSEVSDTLEISEGGMLAYTSLRLKVGDQLSVHFNVSDNYLRARAEVVYLIPDQAEGRAKVGLRFKRLFEEYRSTIREYIN